MARNTARKSKRGGTKKKMRGGSTPKRNNTSGLRIRIPPSEYNSNNNNSNERTPARSLLGKLVNGTRRMYRKCFGRRCRKTRSGIIENL